MYNKELLSHRLRRRIKDASHSLTCTGVAHHWLIDEPAKTIRGSYPLGRCKFCGAVARFSNHMSTKSWGWNPTPKTEEAIRASQDAKVAALAG
jgi:hypothetical protein